MNRVPDPVVLTNGDWTEAFDRLDDRNGGVIWVPAGEHACEPVRIDLAAYDNLRNNVTIRGAGPGASVLNFGTGAGDGFSIVDSSGADVFYTEITDIGIHGQRDGVLFRLGRDDYADAYNSCRLTFTTNNGSPDGTAACRLNYVLNTDHFGVHNAASGTALDLGHFQFGGIRGSVSSRGGESLVFREYSLANVVEWLNVEACQDGVRITGADCQLNSFGMLYGANVAGTLWRQDAQVATRLDTVFVGENVDTVAESTAGEVSVGLTNVPAGTFERQPVGGTVIQG